MLLEYYKMLSLRNCLVCFVSLIHFTSLDDQLPKISLKLTKQTSLKAYQWQEKSGYEPKM